MIRLRNRTWLIVVSAVTLVAVIVAIWLLAAIRPRKLHVATFQQIKLGMTQEQVESLLGGPPGDYGVNAGGKQRVSAEGYIAPPGSIEKVWFNDNNHLEIYFDSLNRVVGLYKRAGYRRSPPPPLWDRLLRYFGISRG